MDTEFVLEFFTPSFYELVILTSLLLMSIMIAALGGELKRIRQPSPESLVGVRSVDDNQYPNDDCDCNKNRKDN